MRVYVNRYAVLPGRQAVIATTGASAYRAALDLKRAGAEVTVVDLRRDAECGPELGAAIHAGIEVLNAHAVIGTVGHRRVRGLVVARLGETGEPGARRTLACDCAGVSGGWTPAVHLFSQSRGKLAFAAALDAFVPGTSAQAERSAGSCRGIYDLAGCIADGIEAGGGGAGIEASPSFVGFRPASVTPAPAGHKPGKAFVDFQNDVTAKDIRLAVREGFGSIEHVKRYTTTGMASDQGKTSNMNALGVVAGALGRAIAGNRPHHLPAALYAGHVRRLCRSGPRRPVRSGTRDAHPRLGRGARRRVRGCRAVEARLVLPGQGRGHACRGGPRVRGRAPECRHLRCLDARQDRGGRARRGRVHEPHLHQCLGEARARPLPLWPDAERGWLRH